MKLENEVRNLTGEKIGLVMFRIVLSNLQTVESRPSSLT